MRIRSIGGVACMALLLVTGPTAAQDKPGPSQTEAPPSVPAAPSAPAEAQTPVAPASGTAPSASPATAPTPEVSSSLLPKDLSVAAMFNNADAVVKTVMIGLIVASVVTWTFLLAKGISILLARRSVARALAAAEAETSLAALQLRLRALPKGAIERAMTDATAAELQLSNGHDPAGVKDRVASRLERLNALAGRRMARGTGVLATIGSTAPFIGLFGTVWGIMNSFIGISHSQTTNLAVVAPGIAEALLATATGLIAAIPAVVIYNVFARAISDYRAMLTDLAASVLRLVSRELDRHGRVRVAAAAE